MKRCVSVCKRKREQIDWFRMQKVFRSISSFVECSLVKYILLTVCRLKLGPILQVTLKQYLKSHADLHFCF